MSSREEGFSIVEAIIAMFLLMVLALAVLPLIAGATRASVTNTDLVAANTFANSELAAIKTGFSADLATSSRCSDLSAKSTPAGSGRSDPAGSGLTAVIAVGACPGTADAYPATIPVTVSVRDASGARLTTLPTLILVVDP
ncbi:prepilin-type N-terminal cleavage/methylation domain-containing protein [Microbacterium gallinarum]|uniref:Prepilin-type N-terminal cleavage/methylation domain-containing protein n=1 Tax=Microbacterium gallinarum TaxID=2762209 RepID=A0ABR8X3G9_9MICO|nr:prepilin-type N-terminal cleavage/methylation domain-containing protein [Microbacterium gallinarum]MBD8023870.1 prepilin-type N-terminal cleavage/methylation domain-containing protein [Microbacterium gallinarum]